MISQSKTDHLSSHLFFDCNGTVSDRWLQFNYGTLYFLCINCVDNDQLKNRNTEYWYDCYDCYLQERSLIKCQVLLSLCEPVWTALVVSVRRSVRIAGDVSLEYKLQLPCYSHFPPISMHQV